MQNLRPKNFSEFFHLQSALDSEFFRETQFFRGGSEHQLFFGHTKFEIKNFSEFFNLQRTVDAQFFRRGSGHQLVLVTLNLRSKIFRNFFLYQVL